MISCHHQLHHLEVKKWLQHCVNTTLCKISELSLVGVSVAIILLRFKLQGSCCFIEV